MHKFLFPTMIFFTALVHADSYLDFYQKYTKNLGPQGSYKNGEIEIAITPEKIGEIEAQTKARLIKKGVNEAEAAEWSHTGVVGEDNFWLWLRDPVIFPSGALGTYDRLLWKSDLEGLTGVAVMPVLSDKKILLILTYRHATRSWELELPRGGQNKGETIDQTAIRELQEETGCQIDQTVYLGTMAPDSGVIKRVVPVYMGTISKIEENKPEFSEAIANNVVLTKDQLKEGFIKGSIQVTVNGKTFQANCRDPFLAYALLIAESKKLL
jgi:ADP-ribose pyrophosphatase